MATALLNVLLSLASFSICIIAYTYVHGRLKLIQCTMCDKGIRTLKYNDIAHHQIITISVVFALIPWLISGEKNWRKNRQPITANKQKRQNYYI